MQHQRKGMQPPSATVFPKLSLSVWLEQPFYYPTLELPNESWVHFCCGQREWARCELLLPAIPSVQALEHKKVLGLYRSAFLSSFSVTGKASPAAVWNISTSSGLSSGARAWGRQERLSQLACCVVPQNSMQYEKATRKRYQHCTLVTAITGTTFPRSIMYFKGWWSVTKVKLQPSR